MSLRPASLDEELCCPVCYDIFSDPVVLRCSHSFCRQCLDTYWKDKAIRDCPFCRRRSSTDSPPANLALRNIVEFYHKKQTEKGRPGGSGAPEAGEPRCSQHGERLLLFCAVDQEALCMVCHTSWRHRDHQLCPIDEAASDLKKEVRDSLKLLKERLAAYDKVKQQSVKTGPHIQAQSQQTESQIKKEFQELHRFLWAEEATRTAALVSETKLKGAIVQEQITNLTKKMALLSITIGDMEKQIEEEDVSFLKAYGHAKRRAHCTVQDPEPGVSGMLINVAKHLGSLKFRVWEKMLETVQYTPVTLDPNTAAPWLSLSDDLTAVRYQEQRDVPDNPERCDLCVCVIGSEGFAAGRHFWEVEVANKTKWDLGVLKESIHRKGVLRVNPAQGFWAIALREGSRYSACSQPWIHLTLKKKPKRIRVLLDCDGGQVSFFDRSDMSLIYTFRDTFTEKLFPYFSPCVSEKGINTEPLKICPAKVSIAKM